ncbi:hypothetical protein SAMN05216417_107156 [Nitrosospira multiformis]|uniref:Uncharacterized protein n=1 Tax=Nitrosospira multiformis TaxID=1231 RepID=A0A1I7H8M2_9PROT|nr:hypothetical protein SAMN05216417_107156 [Nitrosospira multiformis]
MVRPGTAIDITLPIWRLGEALLYVSRFAFQWGENPTILTKAEYVGLDGRTLKSITGTHISLYERKSHTDAVVLEGQTSAMELRENLTEVLYSLLLPFYEIFDFYQPPIDLIAHEVGRLRAGRF